MSELNTPVNHEASAVTWKSRAILTLAVGKPLYFSLATNLARSFSCWHRESDIRFFLATDSDAALPPDLKNVSVIHLETGEAGEGFSAKLHLDKLAPADRTLFIDADCLCTGHLNFVFDRFQGSPVGVVGGSISGGEWFGDVRTICDQFAVAALPKFNGGIYYIERGDMARSVYTQARELEKQYDQLGLKRLRNRPNDELLIAIAMARHGLAALPDDGSFLSSPFECPGPLTVDAIRGCATLINPPAPDARHNDWYPFTEVHPVLVHFLGDFHRHWTYRREAMRLRFARYGSVIAGIGKLISKLCIEWPARSGEWLKTTFRPLFHVLFGARTVHRSERL